MIRLSLLIILALFFSSPFTSAEPEVKTDWPLIYNEEALTKQLKGRGKEEVLKVLGKPAVKKPCEECEQDLEYWWYSCI